MTEEEPSPGSETDAVRQRYLRRSTRANDDRYSMLNPATWQTLQERQRLMLRLFSARCDGELGQLNLIEVGCGSGGNLLELLRFGFSPHRLIGVELLEGRAAKAREVLPQSLKVHVGDALEMDVPDGSQDIIYQAVVFSSLLDREFQMRLAGKMWNWLRPGGAILWYDFVYDNPFNPDVRGVRLAQIKELFPAGKVHSKRLTLAPPIARRVCRIHPVLYSALNCMPWLRTHVLCWIEKS